MNITILGCGRWGSFLAWHFNRVGFNVLLWGRATSKKYIALEASRENEYLKLPSEITLSTSLSYAIDFSDIILIAINEQNLRELIKNLVLYNYYNKTFIICMKGIEKATCKRLSEVVYDYVKNDAQIAIMVGPGQPSDLIKDIPTCFLIDSNNNDLSLNLADILNSQYIRIQPGNDLIGNEIGAAVNKIVGIAGGILDELECSSLKGLLMVAGTNEISKLIGDLGGNPESAYGICCLGDYQASVYSEHSNSVAFGKSIVKNKVFTNHVPGAFTACAIKELSLKYSIDIPLLLEISNIIISNDNPKQLINLLKKYNW